MPRPTAILHPALPIHPPMAALETPFNARPFGSALEPPPAPRQPRPNGAGSGGDDDDGPVRPGLMRRQDSMDDFMGLGTAGGLAGNVKIFR